MASLKAIRKRIVSVRNTQQITKAMKMVAAAKLRRAQEAVVQSRPYAKKLGEVVAGLASESSLREHPLVRERNPQGKVMLLALTSGVIVALIGKAGIVGVLERFARRPDARAPAELVTGAASTGDHR